MILTFNDKAFGKNDIRGIYGETVTAELFYFTGKAFSNYITQKSKKDAKDIWVTVARDARHHSLELSKALIKGLTSTGVNVIDLGLAPTPIGYYSEVANLNFDFYENKPEIIASLVVTASHNPPEYNGLKMTYNKSSLSESEIAEVRELTRAEYKGMNKNANRTGYCKEVNIIPQYIENMANSFSRIGEGLKIVVDSANATAGVVAPELYRELGCEVIDIFTEPDGNFPNHHPNPSDEKTLDAIKAKIKETGADFGIAFDGDSDRIGIVDNTGYSIPGDQLLLIFALDILKELKNRNEKPVFISEVKCSQVLFDMINANGGNAIMWKTGHGYIKTKMKEEKAVLAGEMSGHIFFRDRYYGFDDAIYAGCRFIEIMAKNRRENPDIKVSDLIDALPKMYTSREVRFPCPNEIKPKVLENLKARFEENPNIFGEKIKDTITLDGLRIVFNSGFALIRASNTEPVFTLRFEAGTQENLDKYRDTMLKELEKSIETVQQNALI